MSHRNFFDNDSPAEISETTTHRQKFLRQGSTEISGTTVQRNFWDNDPQKFKGRLERINFWGPLMRSRLYFQFALRFQFPSANEKNHFLRQFTARSSWYVIENKARQGASFIFLLYSPIFFFLLYRSGRDCLSPNTPKKLMMPLLYYHLKHASIKQTKKKTGTNGNNGIRFQN